MIGKLNIIHPPLLTYLLTVGHKPYPSISTHSPFLTYYIHHIYHPPPLTRPDGGRVHCQLPTRIVAPHQHAPLLAPQGRQGEGGAAGEEHHGALRGEGDLGGAGEYGRGELRGWGARVEVSCMAEHGRGELQGWGG